MNKYQLLKRVALFLPIGAAFLIVCLPVQREWLRYSREKELAAAFAETDATDPRWRWKDMEADRVYPPPGQNSAELLPRWRALMPKDWIDPTKPTPWEPTIAVRPPNELIPADEIATIRKQLEPATEARALARSFKDLPNGNYRLAITPDVISTKVQHMIDTRAVISLLRWDTILLHADHNKSGAADNLMAMLNVSRSIGDEPMLISQLTRVADRTRAARSLGWLLSQTELTEPELERLQTAWASDAEEPLLLYGVRGERAIFDICFENFYNGHLNPSELGPSSINNVGGLFWWLNKVDFIRDRTFYHRWMDQAVNAVRLPAEQQQAAIDALPSGPDDELKLAQLLMPAVDKCAKAHWRSIAECRCVVQALACERYRLKTGKWPTHYSEIPPAYRPKEQRDPFTGHDLHYKLLEDGIVIYSVSTNKQDDGGAISHEGKFDALDIGIRLWSPKHRGVNQAIEPEPK